MTPSPQRAARQATHVVRLEALQAKVVGSFGEALSGEAPPPEPSGGEDADAAEG